MKKLIVITSLLWIGQAQAVTIVVPHVSAVYLTPHVLTPNSTSSEVTASTTSSASKMTNTSKTVTPNVLHAYKIIETQGSKEVSTVKAMPVGSLNSSVKSFGCEVPKVPKKVEPPKCDK